MTWTGDPTRRVRVELAGLDGGEEAATWGQQAVWGALEELGEHAHQFNLDWLVAVPRTPHVGLDTVTDAIGWLIARHESLRTLFHRDATGRLRQRVLETLAFDVEVKEVHPHGTAPTDTDADGKAVEVCAAEAVAAIKAEVYDHGTAVPFRALVITESGRPHTVVLGFSHMAADFEGTDAAAGDLIAYLAAAGVPVADAPPQPRQLARDQTSQRGRAQSGRAIAYWTSTLAGVPVMRLAPDAADPRTPRFWRASMRSEAVYRAVLRLSRATGVSTTAVLLAAVAQQLGVLTGSGSPCLMVMVSNRARAPYQRLVSPMAIEGLLTMPLADADFTELAARAWRAGMRAYRYAQFDKPELLRALADVLPATGPGLNLACYFNDLRFDKSVPAVTAADDVTMLRASVERTTTRWVAWTDDQGDETLAFHVYDPDGAIEITLTADTEALGPDRTTRALRAIEAALVDAACGLRESGDAPADAADAARSGRKG